MGSIYRRGTIYWLKYYQHGRVIRESSGTDNKTAAVRTLRLREGDIAKDIPVSPKAGRITFEEAVSDLINDYKTNQRKSLSDVERRIKLHLRPWFGHHQMAKITTAHVRGYSVDRL